MDDGQEIRRREEAFDKWWNQGYIPHYEVDRDKARFIFMSAFFLGQEDTAQRVIDRMKGWSK